MEINAGRQWDRRKRRQLGHVTSHSDTSESPALTGTGAPVAIMCLSQAVLSRQ
ncbi:hypothetical protein PISMIDRAFT_686215 [Pisolithus microcarpus 441]|uniref:Uncharacterized protein n=1 Tax=Pisolithus microcarpus 441 TaxID=765257 RepID=A0A0C9Z2F1_9AGAM|nr:hypothetical protein PISMIDRAFT_686215 [Pisolithus microcarpus 441]